MFGRRSAVIFRNILVLWVLCGRLLLLAGVHSRHKLLTHTPTLWYMHIFCTLENIPQKNLHNKVRAWLFCWKRWIFLTSDPIYHIPPYSTRFICWSFICISNVLSKRFIFRLVLPNCREIYLLFQFITFHREIYCSRFQWDWEWCCTRWKRISNACLTFELYYVLYIHIY